MHDHPPAAVWYFIKKHALSKQDERAFVVPPAFTAGCGVHRSGTGCLGSCNGHTRQPFWPWKPFSGAAVHLVDLWSGFCLTCRQLTPGAGSLKTGYELTNLHMLFTLILS
jgi:hypothetical protein